ncbi:sugar transferase [Roseibium sediminicola]|uniref:Sugar transferase n=1 Tax=Roseibium sediminicola TaxID=2933272 RepID=A0ABT0GT62_9HYPH|nr:sugar transferase [Roseibium sp. CAU 1639]MCK7612616.1 sugar transferase [Roseibium sp. CAU 1639]
MMPFATQVSAATLLVLLAPLLAGLALLVWIADRQPPFYLARRVGRNGQSFRMVKFRTMRTKQPGDSPIAAVGDDRVTGLGRFLRNAKLDELPQLFNILSGDMTFFGPRPEDPGIVARSYDDEMRRSLEYMPGLFSPGTLWAMKNVRLLENAADPETAYARDILPTRLALDTAYFRQETARANLHLILGTASLLLKRLGSEKHRE